MSEPGWQLTAASPDRVSPDPAGLALFAQPAAAQTPRPGRPRSTFSLTAPLERPQPAGVAGPAAKPVRVAEQASAREPGPASGVDRGAGTR